jgi:hypothetical protein
MQNRKIYSCYSPTHRRLLEEHFLPSIPSGFDVVLRRFDQVCASGDYKSEGWGEAMKNKIGLILEAIDHESEPFIFSDVDVRFYDFGPEHLSREMSEENGNLPEIRFQNDNGGCCSGFMFIKPCQRTKSLFQTVLEAIPRFNDDQDALNGHALPLLLKTESTKMIRTSLLPRRYWNIGPNWDGLVPNDITIHHGNWVVGVDNKLKVMDDVLRKLKASQP